MGLRQRWLHFLGREEQPDIALARRHELQAEVEFQAALGQARAKRMEFDTRPPSSHPPPYSSIPSSLDELNDQIEQTDEAMREAFSEDPTRRDDRDR